MQQIDETDWRAVPGFTGYFASADGRIMSRRWGRKQILKPATDSSGYRFVNLTEPDPREDGKRRARPQRVHRLVAVCWLNPPKHADQEFVIHIDGDRSNNAAANLKWASKSEISRAPRKKKGGAK